MNIHTRIAKAISFGNKRSLESVKYIVVHYTGNKGDTAKNNADYFATSNTRQAGAHFFVDKSGDIWKSININRIAFAVGGKYSLFSGAGAYYGKCTNTNSVSIELCDCCDNVSFEQMKATRNLVNYIREKCPNAKTIIRHWDVNGKSCPAPMVGTNNKKWNRLHCFLENGYQLKVRVIKKAALRASGKVTAKKLGTAAVGTTLKITKIAGNWGRLKKKDENGNYRWISLSKVSEV